MFDDKLFHYLVSRVHTREISTHTMASIASSTSLVLLVLFLSDGIIDKDNDVIRWIGLLSPIIGFSYFEITFATQQNWDYHEISDMIKKDSSRDRDELNKIIYGKSDSLVIPKMLLWRILLILPFIGWLSIGQESSTIVIIILIISIAIFLLILRVQLKKRNEKAKS